MKASLTDYASTVVILWLECFKRTLVLNISNIVTVSFLMWIVQSTHFIFIFYIEFGLNDNGLIWIYPYVCELLWDHPILSPIIRSSISLDVLTSDRCTLFKCQRQITVFWEHRFFLCWFIQEIKLHLNWKWLFFTKCKEVRWLRSAKQITNPKKTKTNYKHNGKSKN